MNNRRPPVTPTYASGYARGRNAAKERIPANDNPFPSGSPAYHGWNDGHYDERSARSLEIERYNAFASSRETGAE
jgi:hypothetical protein